MKEHDVLQVGRAFLSAVCPVLGIRELPRRTIGEIVQNSLFRLSICGRVGTSCALRAEGAERPIGNASLTCLADSQAFGAPVCCDRSVRPVRSGGRAGWSRGAQLVHSSLLSRSQRCQSAAN